MKAQLLIIGYQLAFVLIVSALAGIWCLKQSALMAILYGGCISVTASVVMACRLNQAVKKIQMGKQRGRLYVHLGVIERLLIALAFFALGILLLKLSPVFMVAGLIAGQVGFMIGGLRVKE